MKKQYLPLLSVLLPLVAQAGLPEKLKELDELRLQTALCTSSTEERAELLKSLKVVSKRGKKGEFTASEVMRDYDRAVENCNEMTLKEKLDLKAQIKSELKTFPLSIMNDFQGGEEEQKRNDEALVFIKNQEEKKCDLISRKDIYDNSVWHQGLLQSGWSCIADNFIRLSQSINEEMNFPDAQERFEELSSMNLAELKKLFKKTYKIGTSEQNLKIAFVPQLSWENGTLNTVFPYRLFTKPTELTSYPFLIKEMKKLGVPATMIKRNSLAPLHKQVEETKKGLLSLTDEHLVISRSMGSRIMREIVAENDPEINTKISSWFNVGGTPHGSVIARAKIHPDNFYRGLVPSVVGAFKLPVGLISKDPRVASHIGDTLLSAIIRANLKTLESSQAKHLSHSKIPVVNAVFVRNDHQRAAPTVDPVWMHMLQYGPTEGSSLLTGSAVDTSRSMRLIVDSDHLAFWKYQPEEALAVFLRLMIVSKESQL